MNTRRRDRSNAIDESRGGTSLRGLTAPPTGELCAWDLHSRQPVWLDRLGGMANAATSGDFATADRATPSMASLLPFAIETSADGATVYASETRDDALLAIDVATGTVTTLVGEAAFDAVVGVSFAAGPLARLPGGAAIALEGLAVGPDSTVHGFDALGFDVLYWTD